MNRLLIFHLGILGYSIILNAAEPDFSAASVQQNTQQLQSADRTQRLQAVNFLTSWAKKDPVEAKKLFLELLLDSKEPEVRERSLQLLKPLAAQEFGSFGEGYLGVSMGMETLVNLPDEEKPCYGLTISAVTKESPAEKAGVIANDVLIAVGNMRWHDVQKIMDDKVGLSASIRAVGAGKATRIGVWRNNGLLWLDANLTRRPGNIEQMQFQLAPNGAFRIDEEELNKMVEEEKNSAAYFAEWLERQLEPTPQKK